jgi:hypothetical protein
MACQQSGCNTYKKVLPSNVSSRETHHEVVYAISYQNINWKWHNINNRNIT